MATLAPIKVVIAGVDKVSNVMAKVQKRINKVSAKMRKVGTRMSTGITAPATIAGAAIFKAGYQFDKFMNTVEAKSTVSGKSIEQLRKRAIELGSSTSFSHIQAAEAMGYLAQAGYKTGQTFKAILPVLNLAQATNISLGESADWLSNIMGGMGWGAKRSAEAAAILATTTAKANVSMEELSYTFADVGPVAKMYGASLRDVAAASGYLGNLGIKGTKAGTALKTMFMGLADQTPKAMKAMAKMGIMVEDGNGKLRDFKDVLADMAKVLPKMRQKDAIEAMAAMFGKRAISGVVGLTDSLTGANSKFTELFNTVSKANPANLQKMVNTMRKGSVGAFDDTVSALQGLGQAIADSGLMVFISTALKGLTKVFRLIAAKSPAVLKMATVFTAIAATIGPLLIALGTLLPFITAIGAKIAAAGGALALISNPIGWAVAGVIALTVATAALWRHIEPLRVVIYALAVRAFKILEPLLKSIKRLFFALGGAIAAIIKAFQPLLEIIGVTFGSGTLTGLEIFVTILEKIVNIVTWLVEKFTALVNLIGRFSSGLSGVAKSIGQYLGVFKESRQGTGGYSDTWKMLNNTQKLGYGNYSTARATGAAAINKNTAAEAGTVTVDFKNLPAGTAVNTTGKNINTNTDIWGNILVGGL